MGNLVSVSKLSSIISKNRKIWFSFSALCLSFIVFLYGKFLMNYNVILMGVISLFISNVIYGFFDWKNRFIYLFFHLSLFTFLLTRPLISFLRGNDWWNFSDAAVNFALNALFISLLFLRFGSLLTEILLKKIEKTKKEKQIFFTRLHPILTDFSFLKALRFASFALYIFSIVFFFLIQFEKLSYMQGKNYADIYINYESHLPGFIRSISTLAGFSLRLYLATLPKKKPAFFVLSIYVLSAVPELLIGARNSIVLNVLFALIYYIFRNIIRSSDEKPWIGKTEKILIVVSVPVAFVFLGAVNYIRDSQKISMNLFELVVDFFYKQGVSFDVLCRAYEALPNMVHKVYQNFTFGPFIDYFTRSKIGTAIFQSVDLGTKNSEVLALFGNSFSHSMSYVAHPEYLSGHGWGSSYILELFADWGYFGIVVGSLLFGGVCELLLNSLKKGIILRTIALSSISNLLFSPRSEATKWLLFIVTPGFWITVIICFAFAFFCKKCYYFKKRKNVTMFDQCGFMDVIYALFKRKFFIVSVAVIFGLLGFLIRGLNKNDINTAIQASLYEETAYYEIIDINKETNDISQQYANTVLVLSKADFSVAEIFDNITQKYSNEEIINYLQIDKKSDDLVFNDITSYLKGSVLPSTAIVNISVSSADKQFSRDLLDAYKSSLEKCASILSGIKFKYINGSLLVNDDSAGGSINHSKYSISFNNLGLIGFIAGFIFACAFVILKAFFSPTLNRKSDFKMFDIPVLGEFNQKKEG